MCLHPYSIEAYCIIGGSRFTDLGISAARHIGIILTNISLVRCHDLYTKISIAENIVEIGLHILYICVYIISRAFDHSRVSQTVREVT